MKKKIMMLAVAAMAALGVSAQGEFKSYEGKGFTMHVYNSNDVMADCSFIIETKKGLVTMEEPLFKSCVKEFEAYVAKLGKPVTARITDYHEGGTGNQTVVQPEGMPQFMHEGVYDAMMKGFQKNFGDKMVERPTGKAKEVKFGATEKINGVSYLFNNGPKNDFPAATILIGKDFCLMHWAPAKTHMNALQVANRDAVAQALEGAKAAKALGAKYYLGSHGGVATPEDLDFRIAYLTKMEQLLADNKDAASFAQALKNAYPNLPGAEGVDAVAANLYK